MSSEHVLIPKDRYENLVARVAQYTKDGFNSGIQLQADNKSDMATRPQTDAAHDKQASPKPIPVTPSPTPATPDGVTDSKIHPGDNLDETAGGNRGHTLEDIQANHTSFLPPGSPQQSSSPHINKVADSVADAHNTNANTNTPNTSSLPEKKVVQPARKRKSQISKSKKTGLKNDIRQRSVYPKNKPYRALFKNWISI